MSKPTDKDNFNRLIEIVTDAENVPDRGDLLDFLKLKVLNLENHAEKVREKNMSKRLGDPLRNAILSHLSTENWICADELLEAIEMPDMELSKPKIISRCTALVKDGFADKNPMIYNDKRVMGYKRKAEVEE